VSDLFLINQAANLLDIGGLEQQESAVTPVSSNLYS
jgi:hypothetical protein